MDRDQKIACVIAAVTGSGGCSAVSTNVKQLVENCASAVDTHWPTPDVEAMFKEKPLKGVIGWAQRWDGLHGEVTHTFELGRDHRHLLTAPGWKPIGEVFPVGRTD